MRCISYHFNLDDTVFDVGVNMEGNGLYAAEQALGFFNNMKLFVFYLGVDNGKILEENIKTYQEGDYLQINYDVFEREKNSAIKLGITYFDKKLWVNTHIAREVIGIQECDRIVEKVDAYHQDVLCVHLGEISRIYQDYGARRIFFEEELKRRDDMWNFEFWNTQFGYNN